MSRDPATLGPAAGRAPARRRWGLSPTEGNPETRANTGELRDVAYSRLGRVLARVLGVIAGAARAGALDASGGIHSRIPCNSNRGSILVTLKFFADRYATCRAV